MSDTKLFTARVLETNKRANEIKDFAYQAQFLDKTCHKSDFISDSQSRSKAIVDEALKTPLFDGVNRKIVEQVAPVWGEAVREYALKYGTLPNNEMLANAHQACERLMLECGLRNIEGYQQGSGDSLMFESVRNTSAEGISDSNGVMRQALFAAMIMPYTLGATTSDMATFVPCARDNSDIYTLRTVAGNTFGDLKAGDYITPHTAGNYSQMKRRSPMKEKADGSIKVFNFKVADAENRDIAIRSEYSRLIVNGYPTQAYDSNGKLTWYKENGSDTPFSTATIDINVKKGEAKVTFDVAPPAGTDILFEHQLDVERKGELIPTINQVMEKRTIKPNQYYLASEYTIQALFDGRREFNIDTGSSLLTAQRDLISHEIDMTRLRVAIDFNRHFASFDVAVPMTQEWGKYVSLLKGVISQESSKMANRNFVRGIRGIFAGASASEIIKQLPATEFQPAQFSDSPRIQYIGRLFGRYNVYQVPEEVCEYFANEGKKFDTNSLLCYGRGENIGEAGVVTGDAVPLLPITHPTDSNLVNRNTMFGSMINDVNPFNGWDYFVIIQLTSDKEDSYNFDGSVNPAKKPEGGDEELPPVVDGDAGEGKSLNKASTETDAVETEKTTKSAPKK